MCEYFHTQENKSYTDTDTSFTVREVFAMEFQRGAEVGEKTTYLSKYSWQVAIKGADCSYGQDASCSLKTRLTITSFKKQVTVPEDATFLK